MKLHKDKKAMEALISNISERTKIRRDVLEKDYYVTLVLEELSNKENQNYTYFKGGTALYKALKSVRRFSEDIDLTVYVNDLNNNSQKRKRLRQAVLGYQSFEFKEKLIDRKGCIEVIYKYDSLFQLQREDTLQRVGNVKIEATSFTISEPIMMLEIAPHLYELSTKEEKEKLELIYDVKPFNIGTVSMQRIFVDKIFAAEFYYQREMIIEFCKHIYDVTIMYKLDDIEQLFNDRDHLVYLVNLKRLEETERNGGISNKLSICNFGYLNDQSFYFSEKFNNSLKYIHNTYVFNKKDFLENKDILNVFYKIKQVFYEL